MSAALEELDKIMAEPNERIRLGLYRHWKERAVARVGVNVEFSRLEALKLGEKNVMARALEDGVRKLARAILDNSAVSYVQMPVVNFDATRVFMRCDLLKEQL